MNLILALILSAGAAECLNYVMYGRVEMVKNQPVLITEANTPNQRVYQLKGHKRIFAAYGMTVKLTGKINGSTVEVDSLDPIAPDPLNLERRPAKICKR